MRSLSITGLGFGENIEICSSQTLSFETDHFSTYVITEDQDEEIVNVADTAFNLTKIGITIGLVILVLGIMVIVQVLLKSKKEK